MLIARVRRMMLVAGVSTARGRLVLIAISSRLGASKVLTLMRTSPVGFTRMTQTEGLPIPALAWPEYSIKRYARGISLAGRALRANPHERHPFVKAKVAVGVEILADAVAPYVLCQKAKVASPAETLLVSVRGQQRKPTI